MFTGGELSVVPLGLESKMLDQSYGEQNYFYFSSSPFLSSKLFSFLILSLIYFELF